MSFLTEYLRRWIEENMESSAVRERRWEEHLRSTKASADSVRQNMQHPLRTWGFWKNEKHTAKYETNLDPTISKMPGRSTPSLT